MSIDIQTALDVAASAAKAAATAQGAAERAAEECRVMMQKIREYEARRPIVKETLREVGTSVDLVPVTDKVAALEAAVVALREVPPPLPAVRPDGRIDLLLQRVQALEARKMPIPVVQNNDGRLGDLERMILDTRDRITRLGEAQSSEVVPNIVNDIIDRMAALEALTMESMQAPEVLARQLRMTAEVMQAMDDRAKAMREADIAMLEMHRKASEQTALSQGGLAAVVESMKVEMDALASAVAHIRNQLSRRDAYTASIVKRGAA